MRSMVEAGGGRNGHCGYRRNGAVGERENWTREMAVPRIVIALCNLLGRFVFVV
jgi:hypothetical protein